MINQNEKRNSKRTEVNWPVSVWHPKASKFFNGNSLNVSSSGALVALPMKVPVKNGQDIEVNFPRSEALAKSKGRFARIKTAKVVRIDRSDAVHSTNVKVGLQFNNDSANNHNDIV